ncbi:hypothetical protein HK104_010575 [Borealophlyctis nickersoniae]|nr:hypothetical protein HK104_010575 [Borealophlyctis nickersoniae]
MFGPANFENPKTQNALTSKDVNIILDTHKEAYGKYTSNYTGRVNIIDGGAIVSEKREHNVWNATGIVKPTRAMWPVEDVVLLTNGLCGSTCAHAARLASDEVGIRVIVKGGTLHSRPFTFSAFPGGNVVDVPQLFDDLVKLNLHHHPLAPQPFIHAIDRWRVNAGVGYSKRKDLPAEYAYKAADCKVEIDEETFFPPGAWKAVAKVMRSGCRRY